MKTRGKIANVYAEALLELALEETSGEESASLLLKLEQELREVLEGLTSEELVRKFFASPLIPAEQKLKLLEGKIKDRLTPLMCHFLCTVTRRKRLNQWGAITAAFSKMADRSLNRRRVLLETATEISEENRENIRKILSSYLGSEIVLEEKVNPRLIGGLKIRSGDLLIDASLLNNLRGVEQRLRESKIIGEGYFQ